MAHMVDGVPEKYEGERKFYECVEKNLPNDIICYYNREVNGMEFDFCLLIKNFGLVIIEVKGWNKQNIIKVESPDKIHTTISEKPQSSPKKQANGYRYSLLSILQHRYGINPLVLDMVCYPFMSEMDYRQCGLDIVSEEFVTLFREDIENPSAFTKKLLDLQHFAGQGHFDKMNNKLFNIVRGHFENDVKDDTSNVLSYSELNIFPGKLNIADINKIVNNYFSGVKQILFLSNEDDVKILALNISAKLKEQGVSIGKSGFILGTDENTEIKIKEEGFSLFIFDCFFVRELNSICEKRIYIPNGSFDQYEGILNNLAKKTNFNFQQYKIEHAPIDKHIVVKAGAGTGKTFSMISRISYLCHDSVNGHVAVPADEIAMLTFTDDAAINMKNRLKEQFKNYFILTKDVKYLDRVSNIERMQISTIHSFAKEIMKNTSLPLGVGADFTTVNGDFERTKILRRVLNEYLTKKYQEDPLFAFSFELSPYELQKFLLRFIDVMQNKGFDITKATIEDLGQSNRRAERINELLIDVAKKAEEEYERFLIENNHVSLKKYIIYLNKCITDPSFNKSLYSYKFMFIDEFQDVDDAQITAFLELQKKLSFRFFIVGDLKQSIYRFRGATMDAFTKMGCASEDWIEYTLNRNYRSDRRLLAGYEPFFEQLGAKDYLLYNKCKDVLIGVKENSDFELPLIEKIEYSSDKFDDNDDLYKKLFDFVQRRKSELEELSKSKKLSPAEKTIAILVRTNFQISSVLMAAKERNLLVESDTNENLYQLQSTIDLCKLTSALINPYNQLYLFDLLSSNNVNIQYPIENLIGIDEQKRVETMISYLDAYFGKVMQRSWQDLINQAQTMPILMVLRDIYEATMPWKTFSANVDKQVFYRTNYEMVFEQLSKTNSRNYLTLESVNSSLLIAITANLESNSRKLTETYDGVKIVCTTIHKSKGLEYDSVYLPFTNDRIGVFKQKSIEVVNMNNKLGYYLSFGNEPIFNNYFNKDNEIIENYREESRILYVAMTRAINKFVWFKNASVRNSSWGDLLGGMPACQ